MALRSRDRTVRPARLVPVSRLVAMATALTAETLVSSPSIPTKYQRVLIQNPEKKGFLSQTKRFPSQICLNENPGPASYSCIYNTEVNSPSFSKKGTTGFVVPKAARQCESSVPGPNVYNLQASFINKSDFNTGVSRVFRLPVAVQPNQLKNTTPAPNQYDVSCVNRERISSVVGTSAFLSKTKRDALYLNKDVPSPGYYDVRGSLIKHGSSAVLSPFKSKTRRIPAPLDHRVPGPGAYNPHQAEAAVKKTLSLVQRRGYHLSLSAPPLIVPKDPPLPGPGQYDIGICSRPSKHPVPTAAFASKTERIAQTPRADFLPGPGFYDPRVSSKQSFFYNNSGVWIPA